MQCRVVVNDWPFLVAQTIEDAAMLLTPDVSRLAQSARDFGIRACVKVPFGSLFAGPRALVDEMRHNASGLVVYMARDWDSVEFVLPGVR